MTVEIAIANLNLCKLLSCLKLIQIKLLVKKNKRVYVFLRPSIVALELNDELLGNSFRCMICNALRERNFLLNYSPVEMRPILSLFWKLILHIIIACSLTNCDGY